MNTNHREPFESFGHFLRAVMVADLNHPQFSDHRLEFRADALGNNQLLPAEGGFLVPEEFAPDLWGRVYATGTILNRCTRMPIRKGNKLKLPAIDEQSRVEGSRQGAVRMYWAEEAEQVSASVPKFRSLTLSPKKLIGLCYATDELASDVPALASWLLRTFGLEAAFMVEDELFNGGGTRGPLGILDAGNNSLITVDGESGQAASTVRPENLAKMAGRLWGPSHRTAVWSMSNEVFGQLATASFANGSPVVETGPNGERLILQMPVELSEYTATLSVAHDVVLADWGQYLVGEIAPQFISSVHVRWVQHEQIFRLTFRVDGHSAWRSPVTPKNSAITQSPFIALGARP